MNNHPILTAIGFTEERETVILCPECGYDYAHLVAVDVYPVEQTKILTVDASGVSVNEQGPPPTRGVTVMLTFQSECQHEWTLTYHFHKGNTTRTESDVSDVDVWRGVIWRD